MTAPKLSHQIPDPNDPTNADGIGRMYSRFPDGEPEVPSITTIIDVLNAKMEWWRGLCAGKEAINVADLIVQRRNELDDEQWARKQREITKWIDEAAVRDMNIASQRGDIIHNYAEVVCRAQIGEDFDLAKEKKHSIQLLQDLHAKHKYPMEVEGYFDAVHKFLDDFNVKPLQAEGTVWNSDIKYAGTNDLLCMINGEMTLVDWKTKKKLKDPNSCWYKPSIKRTIALQLEAAQHGEEVYSETENKWVEWQGQQATQQIGVAIGPEGYEAIRVIRNPLTWETFKALRTAWDWTMPDAEVIESMPLKP